MHTVSYVVGSGRLFLLSASKESMTETVRARRLTVETGERAGSAGRMLDVSRYPITIRAPALARSPTAEAPSPCLTLAGRALELDA